MGNWFVYGEFINLDKVLYYLRNISRTFANFLIVGLLLKKIILDSLGWKLNGSEIVKYVVTKLIVGVICINLSWFAVGAIVDVSTILTSAVASLPSTYIASNGKVIKETISQSIGKYYNGKPQQTIDLSLSLCDTTKPISETGYADGADKTANPPSIDEILDKILPDENSVSGPLLYLGIGVIQVQNFLHNTNDPNAISDNLFVISVRVAIIFAFFFSLVLLTVVNIFRLVSIWLVVAFGPILIILYLSDEKELLNKLGDKFSPTSIIKAIFAPVIAVGLMSIGLIVIVIMQSFLQLKTNVEWGDSYISSSAQGSRIGVSNIFDTTIAGDILWTGVGENIKNTFTNILLIIFTLFILYGITTILSSFLSQWFWWSTVKNIAEFGKKLPGGLIKIPTAAGPVSLSAASERYTTKKKKFKNQFNTQSQEQEVALQNMMRKSMGLKPIPSPKDYKELTDYANAFKNGKKVFTANDYTTLQSHIANVMKKTEYYGEQMSISSMQWISTALEIFLKNIATNKVPLHKLWFSWDTILEERKDGDSIQKFIETNYSKNTDTKKFFNKIYEDLWWNSTQLKSDGRDFWTGNMKWKTQE